MTEDWRRAMEERGLKVSWQQTEYMPFCDEEERDIRLLDRTSNTSDQLYVLMKS